MLLVKNAEIYAPEYLGKKDLLICGGKIECIQDSIRELPVECEVLDAEGKILTPGFLDQHVHITGGGGEGSFHTRTPELQMSELVENGITTVVGLLGTDGITRSVDNLYAKTRVLCEEGVSAYMLHMGDDKDGLAPVFRALEVSSVPVRIFRPTHVNRNEKLLEEGYEFLKRGGYIDLTCGMHTSPGECVLEAKKRGLPTEHITMSSDGHGSWSNYAEDGSLLEIGVSGVDALYKELKYMVQVLGMTLEEALPYMTCQVAEGLDLLGIKGTVAEGADADLLLFDQDLTLDTYVARGKIFMKHGEVIRKGTYEK